MSDLPVAILYEHPRWFEPLFAELDRRRVPHDRLFVGDHCYDPGQRRCPYSVVVNRVSAYPSGGSHPQVVLYVQQYLAHLENIGANVINGYQAYLTGASKARQIDVLAHLGLRYPKARVIHHSRQALRAAEGLVYPILVKPNVGGSGTGIFKFEDPDELALAAETGAMDLGIDHTALVQECLPARDGRIIRVEILGGEYLYAISLPVTVDSFNYCPADGCNVENPDLAPEAFSPPAAIVSAVKKILAASAADLGSVEYLVNDRDGHAYYYDINPLSNYVAGAPEIVGFDPTLNLVDYIQERAGL